MDVWGYQREGEDAWALTDLLGRDMARIIICGWRPCCDRGAYARGLQASTTRG